MLQWKEKVKNENLFKPHIVYGYYKCKSNDTQLKVQKWDGGEVTFDFPRSGHERRLCISDYFGDDDTVAFQAVTVGRKVADLFTQVIRNKDDVHDICKKLEPLGFRIIPCILIPSEKNAPSAKFLNLDWSSYSQNTREFIKSVHETAGDVLLTSPSDMQIAASILNAL